MMDAGEGYTYSFITCHEAWWWGANRIARHPHEVAQLMIQRSADEGGVAWEFEMTWHQFKDERRDPPSPRVSLFSDSWSAFEEIPEFFAMLDQDSKVGPGEMAERLEQLGFIDITERENPYPEPFVTLTPVEALEQIEGIGDQASGSLDVYEVKEALSEAFNVTRQALGKR